MTDRGIFEYMRELDVSEEELNDPETLILDLGAGEQQNLAKEVHQFSLRSKVLSIDPRLGLSQEKDLSLPTMSKERRLEGRKNPEPLTIAASSDALPLKNESVKHVYALYSVPYYLENPEQILKTLMEAIRVTKPGGSIKIFPIIESQLTDVTNALSSINGIRYSFILRERDKAENDRLLVIDKEAR